MSHIRWLTWWLNRWIWYWLTNSMEFWASSLTSYWILAERKYTRNTQITGIGRPLSHQEDPGASQTKRSCLVSSAWPNPPMRAVSQAAKIIAYFTPQVGSTGALFISGRDEKPQRSGGSRNENASFIDHELPGYEIWVILPSDGGDIRIEIHKR